MALIARGMKTASANQKQSGNTMVGNCEHEFVARFELIIRCPSMKPVVGVAFTDCRFVSVDIVAYKARCVDLFLE